MANENPYINPSSDEIENNKKILRSLDTNRIPIKFEDDEQIYYLAGDLKDNTFHIGLLMTNMRIFIFDSVISNKLYNGEDCRFALDGYPIIFDDMAVQEVSFVIQRPVIHKSAIKQTKKLRKILFRRKDAKIIITIPELKIPFVNTVLLKLKDHEDLKLRLHEKEMEIKLKFIASTNTDRFFVDTWHDDEFIEDVLAHIPLQEEDRINLQKDSGQTFKRKVIPEDVKRYVWRRDEGKCAYCGSRINLEYDHIIPVSKGGSNTARNIQLLCQDCNRHKSNII